MERLHPGLSDGGRAAMRAARPPSDRPGRERKACFLRTERLFSLTWRGLIRKMEEDSSFFNEGEAVERLH